MLNGFNLERQMGVFDTVLNAIDNWVFEIRKRLTDLHEEVKALLRDQGERIELETQLRDEIRDLTQTMGIKNRLLAEYKAQEQERDAKEQERREKRNERRRLATKTKRETQDEEDKKLCEQQTKEYMEQVDDAVDEEYGVKKRKTKRRAGKKTGEQTEPKKGEK